MFCMDPKIESQPKLPGELGQISNFVKGAEMLREAHIRHNLRDSHFQVLALAGYLALVPDEIKASKFLESNDKLNLVDAIFEHQILMNDRIDMSGKPGLEKTVLEIVQHEKGWNEAFNYWSEAFPNNEETRYKQIFNSLIVETEFMEGWVRLNKSSLTFDDAEKYRNLVNAIANCAISGIFFSEAALDERLKPIEPVQLSFEAIYEKYRWVTSGEGAKNKAEKAIMIAHANIMIAQIEDDWFGREIDQSLGLPSFTTAAMTECGHDEMKARDFLTEVKKGYIEKAKNLGLGLVPVYGMEYLFRKGQEVNRLLTRSSRFREMITKIAGERRMEKFTYGREKLVIQGNLQPA